MTSTIQRFLADIHALRPRIERGAAEMEKARQLPADVVEGMKEAGVFRMFVPKAHGGFELSPPDAVQAVTALSRLDGSVGWIAAIGGGVGLAASLVSRDLYNRIYGEGPDVIIAGSTQPGGTAEKVAGGWRVNGRWPFASGCRHAEWYMGFCAMSEGGKPLPGAVPGMPLVRGIVLPAGAWEIEDTWHVPGMKGTGSHHVQVRDAFAPETNIFDFEHSESCVPGPLYKVAKAVFPLMQGAVSLGIAEGALDDVVALVKAGRQARWTSAPMRESELFLRELGGIQADLRAARALLERDAEAVWRLALDGTPVGEPHLAQGVQTATWVIATSRRAADACFAAGGSQALYEPSPLQRRMRDIHVAAQHAMIQPRQYVRAGAALLKDAEKDVNVSA
ncbi:MULTISPECIES: acyl-CoA dehydrogenase family protein [Rhodomicrobium]|uniref:acyl-CoA dehydrogenase family protein n=1 Tax=Rhodomicrobium TaxID=1068 RepID=UPI001FD938E7|nr:MULTISPECIES: acyl-CoA dehydrogenase family protein [Rhodomicrobium]